MIEFGMFALRSDIFVLILSIILLSIQIILCCNLKNKTIKLIPVCLFAFLTILFIVLALIHNDWDRFGYLVLAALMAILLLICGVGWLVYWAINRKK